MTDQLNSFLNDKSFHLACYQSKYEMYQLFALKDYQSLLQSLE